MCPIPAARSQCLLDLLAQVPDPRKKRGRRPALAGLLAVRIAAVIAGSRSFAAIGQWAADAGPDVLATLGAVRGAAEESTFRRAFALVSADVLDRVLGAWLHATAVRAGGRLVIAIDGKAVRGAKGKDRKAPHLVAALAHGIGAVLGQVAADEKSNEIPAVRELLKAFADLAGAVITIDALHTQSDTAQVILGRGAGYVMTVKGNMPTLYRKLKKLPWAAVPSVAWPSACRAWTAMPISPPPTAITPATPGARSNYFKLYEYDFAGSLGPLRGQVTASRRRALPCDGLPRASAQSSDGPHNSQTIEANYRSRVIRVPARPL